MVSTNQTPPIAMPVHVPPGHVVQQIVDENGTLRHVILSPSQHSNLLPLPNTNHYVSIFDVIVFEIYVIFFFSCVTLTYCIFHRLSTLFGFNVMSFAVLMDALDGYFPRVLKNVCSEDSRFCQGIWDILRELIYFRKGHITRSDMQIERVYVG